MAGLLALAVGVTGPVLVWIGRCIYVDVTGGGDG